MALTFEEIKNNVKNGYVTKSMQKAKNFEQIKSNVKSGKYDFGVDEDYIQSYLNNVVAYSNEAIAAQGDMTYSGVQSRYNSDGSKRDELLRQGDKIKAYLNSHKSNISKDTYSALSNQIESFRDFTFTERQNTQKLYDYSQTKTPEEYNREVAYSKYGSKSFDEISKALEASTNQEEKDALNWLLYNNSYSKVDDFAAMVSAYDKLIADKQAELDNLPTTTLKGNITGGVKVKNKKDVEKIEAEIAELKAKQAEAERFKNLAEQRNTKLSYGNIQAAPEFPELAEEGSKQYTVDTSGTLADIWKSYETERTKEGFNDQNLPALFWAITKKYPELLKDGVSVYDLDKNIEPGKAMGFDSFLSQYRGSNTLGGHGGTTESGEYVFSRVAQMNDTEKNIYNAIYALGGPDKAFEYLANLSADLEARKGNEDFEKMNGSTLKELSYALKAGLDQFQSGILTSTDDDYAHTSASQYTSALIRDDLSAPLKILYDSGVTLANMAPSMLTSAAMNVLLPGSGAIEKALNSGKIGTKVAKVLGSGATSKVAKALGNESISKALGSGVLGASARGNAYAEALQQGYSKDEAATYANLVGASEAGMQYLLGGIGSLGGKLTGTGITKLASKFDSAFGKLAVELGGKMASEGFEEYLQDVVTPIFKNYAFSTNEKIDLLSSEALYSGLLGALSAGLLEAGPVVANVAGTQATYGDISRFAQQKLIDDALAQDKNSKPYKLANNYYNSFVSKKGLNAVQIDKLTVALQEEGNANLAEMRKMVESALKKSGEQADIELIAEGLANYSSGGTLNANQLYEIDKSTAAKELFTDIQNELTARREADKKEVEVFETLDSIGNEQSEGTDYGTDIDTDSEIEDSETEPIRESVFGDVSSEDGEADSYKRFADEYNGTKELTENQLKAKQLGETFGVKVEFKNLDKSIKLRDGKRKLFSPNGRFDKDTNTLYINSSRSVKHNGIETVLKHELTHYTENAPKTYQKFTETVEKTKTFKRWLEQKTDTEKNQKSVVRMSAEVRNGIIDRYSANGIKIGPAEAQAELMADFVGDVLFEKGNNSLDRMIGEVGKKNKPQFIQSIIDLIQWIRERINGNKELTYQVLKLESKYKRLLSEAQAATKVNTESNTESGGKYSIVALDNGNTYVKASRNVISGNDISEWRKQITSFFNELLDGGESLDINTIDGDVLTITKSETANKARDNYQNTNGQRNRMSDSEFKVKLNAEAHIDEILETSIGSQNKKSDTKSHKFAKDGFTYRTAYFQDFDGTYYRLKLSIGNNGTVATVYNVGKINKDSLPSLAKIVSVVGSKPLGKLSIYSISNLTENVKKNNSESVKKDTATIPKLDERVSGDEFLNAEDLIDEVRTVGGEVDDNGYITLYHRTTEQAKEKILSSGKMTAKEDGIFFSTKKDGQADGYGDAVIEMRIPAEKLVLDDIFDDEAHLRYPLESRKSVLDVSEYIDPENNNDIENLLFDEEFYKTFETEDKTVITESLEELQTQLEEMNDENSTWDEQYEIRQKIKALKEGYKSIYDYYVGHQKENVLKEYKYNPKKFERKFAEKQKAQAKAESLKKDIENADPHKKAQYYLIQKNNPMFDDYHLGIRSPSDIKTFAEVIEDGEGFAWGDFSLADAKEALRKGTVRVYSSYPIKNGVFVSTSYRQALEYAGGIVENVHSRNVALDSVAWINGDEGQYAKVYKNNTQYSISDENLSSEVSDKDTLGNTLTKAQQSYFANSKVRDENGNLKVMYHGTPNADFTVFKSGTYFTENKWYADVYQNQSASSLGYKKTANNPDTYAVYLDIEKPFDTRNKAERDIFYNEYYRQWGTGTDLMGSGLPDWMDGQDLQEFLEENGYDYDGLILDEGGTGGYGDEVRSRGLSYVVFNSEQVKSINNKAPTDSTDYRYSISENSTTDYSEAVAELNRQLNDGEIDRETFKAEVDKLFVQAGEEYGTIKQGERVTGNENFTDNVPKKVSEDTQVKRFARTILEGGNITPEMATVMKQGVLSGDLSYTPTSNEANMEAAVKSIESGHAEEMWQKTVNGERAPSGVEIATGEALLKLAEDRKDEVGFVKLAAELCEVGTRAGRAVQAFSLLKRMGGLGQLYYIQRCVNTANRDLQQKYQKNVDRGKEIPQIKINETLAEQLAMSKTEEDFKISYAAIMQDIAAQVPSTFLDKWNAWRYMSMLTNPTTHIRNIFGNAVFVPAVKIKDVIASGIEHTVLKGDNAEKRTKSVFADKKYKDFAEEDFAAVESVITGSGKMNSKRSIADERPIFSHETLEKIRKFNGDMLEREDGVFLKLHYKRALAGYLQAQNIDLNKISQKTLGKAREYAILEAQKATYRDASEFADRMSNFSRSGKLINIFVEGILPFKKTPVNIVKRGVEYSPIGLLKTLSYGTYQLTKGDITVTEYIDGIAGGLTGTGATAMGMLLASLGIVVGGFGGDDEDYYNKLLGMQEYSVQIGGFSYTIDWAAPVCMPFFMGVTLMESLMSDDNTVTFANVVGSLTSMLEPMIELSMLSGISETIAAARYAETDEIVSSIAYSVLESYITQSLPTIGSRFANLVDPTRRANYIDKSSWVPESVQTLFNTVLGKVPGLSYFKPAYINAWGETEDKGNFATRFFQNFLSPGYISSVEVDEVDKEIKRLYKSTGSDSVFPSVAKKKISYQDYTKNLTADEYAQFATAQGQMSADYIKELIDSDGYSELTDAQRVECIEDLYAFAIAKGKTDVTYTYDDLNKMWHGQISKEQWDKMNDRTKKALAEEYFLLNYKKAVAAENNGGSVVDFYINKVKTKKQSGKTGDYYADEVNRIISENS